MINLKKYLKIRLPTQQEIQKNRYLAWLGPLFQKEGLWSWERQSVAKAVAIGLFSAFMPIPVQLWLSAFLAIFLRANLPMALTSIWVSNPFTLAPMIYFCYWVGTKILHTSTDPMHFSLSWEWVTTEIAHVWKPLVLGSLLCGLIAAFISYMIVFICWGYFKKSKRKGLQNE